MTRIAIHGAAGRMGRRLIALAQADPTLSVAGALEHRGCPEFGRDAGAVAGVGELGIQLSDTLPDDVQAVIDFTGPTASRAMLGLCRSRRVALVIGTTGLTDADQRAIDDAAADLPVLWASNFSRVVNVLHALLEQAAPLFDESYDVEVLEAHHRFKKDAPSGTAISLAQTVCAASGRDFARDVAFTRHGDDVPRKPGEITVQTLRLGDLTGEHTIYFAGPGERLELRHVSTSRDSYARGALDAAAWLATKPPGRYTMRDVLGL